MKREGREKETDGKQQLNEREKPRQVRTRAAIGEGRSNRIYMRLVKSDKDKNETMNDCRSRQQKGGESEKTKIKGTK